MRRAAPSIRNSLPVNYFNYFTEIEDTFIRRRGKHLFLSPLDWALIEVWKEREIPLHIVIRSIESVFDVYDQQPAGTRSIKSLFYCREEVEAQYTEWSRSRAGSSGDEKAPDSEPFPREAITAHIDGAINQLRGVEAERLREDIARAIDRLEQLKLDLAAQPETVDSILSDIEKFLERSMRSNWEETHLKLLENEVAKSLKAYKAEMEPEAYKKTYDLMLAKRLRDEIGIPRLGLFYL